MPITAKGMKMILNHHGLDAATSTDEHCKTCIDEAIKNREELTPEEGEEGGEEGEGEEEGGAGEGEGEGNPVTNRTVAALQKQVAELTKQVNAGNKPIHNRNGAGAPNPALPAEDAEEMGQLIANRASELQTLQPGLSLAQAFLNASKELDKKIKNKK